MQTPDGDIVSLAHGVIAGVSGLTSSLLSLGVLYLHTKGRERRRAGKLDETITEATQEIRDRVGSLEQTVRGVDGKNGLRSKMGELDEKLVVLYGEMRVRDNAHRDQLDEINKAIGGLQLSVERGMGNLRLNLLRLAALTKPETVSQLSFQEDK